MTNLARRISNETLRVAQPADARAIAELFQSASDGIADLIWARHVRGDECLLDIGARAFARTAGRLTCDNSLVIDDGANVVGVVVTFPCGANGASRRIQQLDRIPVEFADWPAYRTLHIGVVAVRPDYQGRGFGARLLSLAETEATMTGLVATTIIAPARNARACRFLLANGYMEFGRQKLPNQPLVRQTGDAVLFAKYTD